MIFYVDLQKYIIWAKMTMKKVFSYIAATAIAVAAADMQGEACTNVLITRGASADGSCMISYAADSHQLFGELYFHPAADWKPGTMLKVFDWDSGKYNGEIPQVAHTYKTVGNMNEHQLIIAETTYGGREELWEQDGIMDYGSLIYIALQRAATAREAIDVIVNLADTYGYCSEGESFSIADKNEVWVMDLIGGGKDRKGILYVARRVPDGYICSHANQARISTFPQNDPENCIYAKDVIDFARAKGWFDGKDEDFSFCDTYAPLDFGGMRGCEARAWSAFNILCEGQFTFMDENGKEVTVPADHYLPYAMGYDKSLRFPLFVKPAKKVSVKDVAEVMRDHYEGTPMDMTQDIGAGGNALPYRWRPMGFEIDGKSYTNERAIATQQTGFWFVGQARGWLPDVIGGIDWFGTDDAATSYLTPIYTNTDEIPECFREGNGDMLNYSATSSFWMNNRVTNACYRMYNIMQPTVKAAIDEWENARLEEIASIDEKALSLYNKALSKPVKAIKRNDSVKKTIDPFPEVRKYLTEYSVNTAQTIFNKWVELEELLLVKYIDGNVKAQDENGKFITNGNKGNIPDGITQPGYTEKWKRTVALTHGAVIEER